MHEIFLCTPPPKPLFDSFTLSLKPTSDGGYSFVVNTVYRTAERKKKAPI